MDVYNLANAHRALLLANDAKTKQNLIEAYAVTDRDLQRRLAALLDLIERRRAAGEAVNRSWLIKEERYTTLLEQVQAQTSLLAGKTIDETTRAVRQNLELGAKDAQSLLENVQPASLKPFFNRMNFGATENVVAYLEENAPLGRLLARITTEMPAEALQRAKDVLLIGVSTGQNPRVVARNFRDATGLSLTRSLTIARTESLRAYRQASLQVYADSEVITSYQWLATKSARTCVACLAMDGRIFEKNEQFAAHVRCRCTCVPVIGEPRLRETGEEWLQAQDESTQNAIMGEAAATAWRKGEVALSDFVGVRKSAEWGASVFHDSLKGARVRASERVKGETGTIPVGNASRSGAKDAGLGQGSPVSEARRQELETLAKAELDAVQPLVSQALGLKSNWSGVVRVEVGMKDKGVKHYECPISLSAKIMDSPDRHRTQIHEMLHAHSVGLVRDDFENNRGWEEACVEQLQRLLRQRVYAGAGWGEAPAYGDALDRAHPYNVYIAALEKARVAFGDEPLPFYTNLLGQPIANRRAVLIRRLLTVPADKRQAVQDACGKAAATLRRDLNVEFDLPGNNVGAEIEASARYLFDEEQP